MITINIFLIILGSVIGLLLIITIIYFNRIVRLRNKVTNAWHQIDVQLNRRYDIIPKLAAIVQGYASHEATTFESVAEARVRAVQSTEAAARATADEDVDGALKSVIAVAENYPDLLANSEFMKLQKELSQTEAFIAGSRKYYNGSVMQYNNTIMAFPGNIVRALFKKSFPEKQYFEISEPEKRAVPII